VCDPKEPNAACGWDWKRLLRVRIKVGLAHTRTPDHEGGRRGFETTYDEHAGVPKLDWQRSASIITG
jgi:hypothetical protein